MRDDTQQEISFIRELEKPWALHPVKAQVGGFAQEEQMEMTLQHTKELIEKNFHSLPC